MTSALLNVLSGKADAKLLTLYIFNDIDKTNDCYVISSFLSVKNCTNVLKNKEKKDVLICDKNQMINLLKISPIIVVVNFYWLLDWGRSA